MILLLIYENLFKWKETQPDKLALAYADTMVSYRELYEKSSAIARSFAATLKKGDKIVLIKKNPLQQMLWFLGAAMAGVIPVLIDIETPEGVREQISQLIKPTLFIDEAFFFSAPLTSALPQVKKEDVFLGALTSGTTGIPKVIWRDHESWSAAFSHQSEVFHIGPNDNLYLAGSLVYTANLNSCLHMLYEGGTIYFAKRKTPKTWVNEIEAFGITSIFMVPSHYQLLLKVLKKPSHTIKSIVSAGAKIQVPTVKDLMVYFPNAHITEYYGTSELGHITFITAKELLSKPDSVGRTFPMVNFHLKEDEIWVDSPYTAPAYRNHPTVGDIGKIDVEGYLYLFGRKNDMINKGGTKIIPSHIEKVLIDCEGIEEVAIIGKKHASKGEILVAYIVKKDTKLTSHQLKEYCRNHLLKHERPQKIYFIEKLPRNTSGKIDREQLKFFI
ncbi:long-chain acyl-CoA synthetase [Anaerovirgula multivorans]|uniref:Long-chain acyl-CoA synthetase n=1 Tax=Anaerovirgula multivorans TaxID=312168 RepID=A0A239BB22_9FIRM|nr:long-chain acyl-CoA synthetase [Anaerovirgula multivorans]